MDKHELDAVMAHEFSHIVNKDSYYLTLGITVGSLTVIISPLILRTLVRSTHVNYRSRRSKKGEANIIVIVAVLIALILSIIAPIIRRYLLSKFSKTREHLVDI